MKVTRERKIYAAVVAIALLGLVLDRTIYGSRDTGADAAQPAPDALLIAPATAPIAAASGVEELSLATRLANTASQERVLGGSDINEPFKSQIAWLTPVRAEAPATGPTEAEQFQQKHTLTAVLGTGQSGYVIVDGACVRIGRSIDGFKLVAVDRGSATFESNGARIKLVLKTGLASSL